MADKPDFAFDLNKVADYFKAQDFSKLFAGMKLPDIDPESLFAAQKKNMEALVGANKAAAAGYQELFQKQLGAFQGAIKDAQDYVKSLEGDALSPDAARKHGEAVKAAFEKASSNMAELAEGAQKAGEDAYRIVAERVQESVVELQALAKNFKA